MALARKVKIALDETRILVLGSEILLGFQFQAVFRPVFERLPRHDHVLSLVVLFLLTVILGLLIAPSMQHQIVERGAESRRILETTGRFAGLALAPLALALGIDLFLAGERVFGIGAALATGTGFCVLALAAWYGGCALRGEEEERGMAEREPQREPTPVGARIDHMLTEARVVLPGAQALLGFQLLINFAESFEALPTSLKMVHMAAMGCVALAVICLIAPAAIHRIAYGGEDTEGAYAWGARFVLAATAALALGIASELYVVVEKILGSRPGAAAAAAAALALLLGLWHALPLALRRRHREDAGRALSR